MEYEAGVRFGNDMFIRFLYNEDSSEVTVTVITPEETLEGTTTVTAG